MPQKPKIKKPIFILMMVFISVVLLACTRFQNTKDVTRIGPQETRVAVANSEALLVCAYDDDACKDILLDGAMLRSEFES